MAENVFYTIRGYSRMEQPDISHTMEDYLEMICRHAREEKFIRVNRLAALLNVRPPSASKMAGKLRESGMVQFEPYGVIRLTPKGEEVGSYLLHRHEVLHRLLCFINRSEDELELVERIEHFFSGKTVANIERLLNEWQPQGK